MAGSSVIDGARVADRLRLRLAELLGRSEAIETDLRRPLEADSEEQAIDLADDEALSAVDDVLLAEISDIKQALQRIDDGEYGLCVICGGAIATARLEAMPTASTCIDCARGTPTASAKGRS